MKFKQNCLHLRMEKLLKPTKLCHNCFKPHQDVGIYCPQCDKTINTMETITKKQFDSLQVGDTLKDGHYINNYEILHKYKEFLIVKCEDGHDLFDLNKINKLGLKLQPKTFMGLEIKKYDNVPCEINGEILVYLLEVKEYCILSSMSKNGYINTLTPTTSIRIL